MANTKSWQVFSSRIASIKQSFQLSDLSLTMAQKHCAKQKDNGKTIAETLNGSLDTHRQLNTPNTLVDINRTFITNRNRLNQQALIELYKTFSYYIKSIIHELSLQDPMRMQGLLCAKTEKNVSYPDIIKLGSYDAIIADMSKKVFRSLERLQSTPELLDKLIDLTGIRIDDSLKEEALLYLELRHLIIHNNAKADDKYISLNQEKKVSINSNTKKIYYNYTLSNTAMNVVYQLCKTIDDELIRLGLV